MLRRLDDLAAHLATRGDVLGVLGLGSAGVEQDRFDEHSDLDFFVVVDDLAAKQRYLDDIGWLAAPAPVAYSFVNDRNGRKALYADGVFCEYAIFTLTELEQLPFTGARVIWARPDAPENLAERGAQPTPENSTVEFHLNEALTNLYVGLHRELRGETLTAARFVQSYAVDRVIALARLTDPRAYQRDVFDPSRRVERAYAPAELPLAGMVPGYGRTFEAAEVTLGWLRARFEVDPVIGAAIDELLEIRARGASAPGSAS
ncbi:hypothetical protein HDA40_007502 [Hamadaea flava]|uniref:Nucleotidyltransferase domain-containing protein n=1 Tax=Hamadaea flava TaxID=1742688 RepID=A0ABV8M015_9ACTN|nr:hypothetical protein [Hamadaea flava]MCP2328995.1 hypothetical protein [Hamadaea flava]